MLEYRYDTQLLIDGHDLDEDKVYDYFVDHFEGDCLIAVGDEDMIKIHYHTNEPWKVLEYCASLGESYAWHDFGGAGAAQGRRTAHGSGAVQGIVR